MRSGSVQTAQESDAELKHRIRAQAKQFTSAFGAITSAYDECIELINEAHYRDIWKNILMDSWKKNLACFGCVIHE